MLHDTEQRRLEATQLCNQLHNDTKNWSTAYNSMAAALGKFSAEYARMANENITLKTELQMLRVNHRSFPFNF